MEIIARSNDAHVIEVRSNNSRTEVVVTVAPHDCHSEQPPLTIILTPKEADELARKLSVVAGKVPTTTRLSDLPSGVSVSFTASVAAEDRSIPTGKVTFYNGNVSIGTYDLALSDNGVATLKNFSALPAGNNSITAEYAGTLKLQSSVSSKVIVKWPPGKVITNTDLSTTPNPSNAGQPVTMMATVTAADSSTPTGDVQFYDGAMPIGIVALSSGVATYRSSTLPVGTDNLSAEYGGSGQYATSKSQTVVQVVN